MSFDHRDIRTRMDVYTLDNVYLGPVVTVVPGPVGCEVERVLEEARQSSKVNGEMFGPVPTQTGGNPGPKTQSAAALYATEPHDAHSLGQGAIKIGRWWGLIGRRTIPMENVQTVSLERVILKHRKEDLDLIQS